MFKPHTSTLLEGIEKKEQSVRPITLPLLILNQFSLSEASLKFFAYRTFYYSTVSFERLVLSEALLNQNIIYFISKTYTLHFNSLLVGSFLIMFCSTSLT